MTGLLPSFGRTLLTVAVPAEARAVCRGLGHDLEIPRIDRPWRLLELGERFDLVVTGVGKANAAGAVGHLADRRRHARVLNVGVAGSLPESFLSIGDAVLASASVYGDEGMQSPQGFQDCGAMGFPLGPFAGSTVPADPDLLARLAEAADRIGPIATVSTCSGTDDRARDVQQRTGAIAEAMEGAAVAHVSARIGVPALELRIISNTTGDRAAQQWDLPHALFRLAQVVGQL